MGVMGVNELKRCLPSLFIAKPATRFLVVCLCFYSRDTSDLFKYAYGSV